MEQFTQTIDGSEFSFHGFLEGKDEVCRVSVEGQNFKMTIGEDGNWEILQQVPAWIKKLEKQLGQIIDKAYC
ncbi:MAG TPA: hypothetical protein VMR70_19235 [Flavisolibacter sp.]|nr:hypothetical protein [Flavisolibacter sp.]